MQWIVEWIAEDGKQCKKFESRKEAENFADDLFDYYPVRVFKEAIYED